MNVNSKSYLPIRLLGKGKGGYSYLVTDGQQEYVLKQIHHEPCEYYQFGDKLASELRDYERLKALRIPMPELLDVDYEQERILKTYIRGETVAELIKRNGLLPEYVEQVREMCRVLYAANLNIDYYPTNFVVQDGKLYYIDFECNLYMPQWDFDNWGMQYWRNEREKKMYIETKRLIITEFTMDMAEAVHRNSLDADNRRFVPDEVFETVEEAEETIGFLMGVYQNGDGPLVYPVLLKDGACIGYVQAVPVEENWEIGYHIGIDYTGRGYATEAVKAFLPVILQRLGIDRIMGICLAENQASVKVLQRCGFAEEFFGTGDYQGNARQIHRFVYQNP